MLRLEKPLSVTGTVIHGEKVGRTIGFPTANLKLGHTPTLKPGVYASVCRLKGESILGLAYFGKRYIFGDKVNSFEVYLINFHQNIYGQTLKVKLTHFIRGPKRLKIVAEIKKALTHDMNSMSEGQVILVNRRDQITGIEEVLSAHRNPPQLHRASSVFLVNGKGEMLIQKRSRVKPLWPLFWSNTSCTNTRPGETPLEAAERSLKREMGLTTKLKFHHQFIYKAKYNQQLSEHEVDSVFTGVAQNLPKLNPKEAAAYRFLSIKDLKTDVKQNPDDYTPWFKLTLKKPLLSDIFKA